MITITRPRLAELSAPTSTVFVHPSKRHAVRVTGGEYFIGSATGIGHTTPMALSNGVLALYLANERFGEPFWTASFGASEGNIERLASGSLRVRMYAGIDALTGGDRYLKDTIPAEPGALVGAERRLDELVGDLRVFCGLWDRISVPPSRAPRASARKTCQFTLM